MGRTSFVDHPIVPYVPIRYNDSVPGSPYTPGMNVARVWQDVLRDRPDIRAFQSGVHPSVMVNRVKRFHYTEQDRCRSCRQAQVVVKHQCRRCYQRTYMRAYYQSHRHVH